MVRFRGLGAGRRIGFAGSDRIQPTEIVVATSTNSVIWNRRPLLE
jgi:hypothetical protein